MTEHKRQAVAPSELEYSKTIDYIHHLYETRSKIFHFTVALNSGLLAAVFQFLSEDIAKLGMSALAYGIMFVVLLMAERSWRYLQELEKYACEIELVLGYSLVTTTSRRMPKGLDTTHYLLVLYGTFVVMWLGLSANYSLRVLGLSAL